MTVSKTPFRGLFVIEANVFADARGYFFESFNNRAFQQAGIPFDFVQENESRSVKSTIRGLHFQRAPYAQSKLVRVIRGHILDVVVDLRVNEPTFKKTFSIELSEEKKRSLYIPKGFAHGFSVLSEEAIIVYGCDVNYNPKYDSGIRHDDPSLGIDWKVAAGSKVVSEKDLKLPLLSAVDVTTLFTGL